MEGVPLIVRQEDLLEYNNLIWEFLCLKKVFLMDLFIWMSWVFLCRLFL